MGNRISDTFFDFDQWAALAKSDPIAFELRRQQEIQKFLQQAPEAQQKHLKGLQYQIDTTRCLHSDPLKACLTIYKKMCRSAMSAKGLTNALEQLIKPQKLTVESARIIPFVKKPE